MGRRQRLLLLGLVPDQGVGRSWPPNWLHKGPVVTYKLCPCFCAHWQGVGCTGCFLGKDWYSLSPQEGRV